jgi:alkylation response protein AidB-like acyl-CoA dehydrogenase
MRAPATYLTFSAPDLPESAQQLRLEVRELLVAERAAGTWTPSVKSWGEYNSELTRKLAERGWIGMTWPRQYGGAERSQIDRFVLTEELLAASAPAGAQWVADRQSGPLILRFGTEEQRQRYLPPITRGESYFCIGMSEPDSGSDLASIRSKADPVDGGWRLRGTKIWTSWAHMCHHIIVLCRTEPASEKKHAGMSQLIVDLKAPGVTIRPIRNVTGVHEFNEIVFDNVFVPANDLVGSPGDGWGQVTSELAFERSGPERILTNFLVFKQLLHELGARAPEVQRELGWVVSQIFAFRSASLSIAARLQAGDMPNVEASLVKDLGTHFQQALPELVRTLVHRVGLDDAALHELYQRATMLAPAYTIQGGTTEILRGIIARGLKLR